MANHFEIKTDEKISPDFVNKHLNYFIEKYLFGLFKARYEDESDKEMHTNWGEHVWRIYPKEIGITPIKHGQPFSFLFWLNDDYNLEFRHSMGKDDFITWIEYIWFEYIAKKIKGAKLYDEGVGYFDYMNLLDTHDGFKSYAGRTLINSSIFSKSFESMTSYLPKEYHIFFENYKEKIRDNTINRIIED